jgi:hypothetical protein
MADQANIEKLNQVIERFIEEVETQSLDEDIKSQIFIDSMQHLQRLIMAVASPPSPVFKTRMHCPYSLCRKPVIVALSTGGQDNCPQCSKQLTISVTKP